MKDENERQQLLFKFCFFVDVFRLVIVGIVSKYGPKFCKYEIIS